MNRAAESVTSGGGPILVEATERIRNYREESRQKRRNIVISDREEEVKQTLVERVRSKMKEEIVTNEFTL